MFARRSLYLLAPQFALITGALLMRRYDAAPAIWMLNLGAGLLFTLFAAASLLARRSITSSTWRLAIAGAALLLIVATFLDPGIDGVHRWIRAGPLYLHAAAIALPVLIFALDELPAKVALFAAAMVMVLLALQPDAAQATAFGAALLVMFRRCRNIPIAVIAAFLVMACIIASWLRPDPLAPVPHVEGIVGLALRSGVPWLLAALLSLALLPVPFIIAHLANRSCTALALGIYFLVLCIAPAFGAFPVPLLGFGISPILGYFIALAWLLRSTR